MKNRTAAFLLLACIGSMLVSSPLLASDDAPEYLGGNPDMPFSDAVRVGNTLYLTGKLGIVPGTRALAEGGIGPETRQTMENIKASLERHGSSIEQVVKCTVFLADIDEWAAMNEVYKTYFPTNKPARSAVGVNGLALDGRVEIECIATVDRGS